MRIIILTRPFSFSHVWRVAMAFQAGPKLTQQLSLPRRRLYEAEGSKVASVRAEMERKMPEGMRSAAEMLAQSEALAQHEARIEELRGKEFGPRLAALEQEVKDLKHGDANLRAMIEAVDRRLEGFGKLQAGARAPDERVPPSVAAEGEGGGGRVAAPSSSPLKPWEAEGISQATWYRRRKKEAGHGRQQAGEVGLEKDEVRWDGKEAEGS